MLWQSKILKQERDREESIEVEREVGEIDRQMEGEKERRVNCNTTGLSTHALISGVWCRVFCNIV